MNNSGKIAIAIKNTSAMDALENVKTQSTENWLESRQQKHKPKFKSKKLLKIMRKGIPVKIAIKPKLEFIPGDKIKNIPRRKKAFKERLQAYAGFLSDDCDYDWSSILEILSFKLRRMSNAIGKHGCSMDRKKTAKSIQEVTRLLDKILNYDYHEDVFKDHYKKYGHPKMVTGKPNKNDKGKVTSYPMDFIYKNGKPATEEMHEESRILYKQENDLIQADIDAAFIMIGKRLREWWD